MMKSTSRLVGCLLIWCATLTSIAQDAESVLKSLREAHDPTGPRSANEEQARATEEHPPREIKFEVSGEELKLALFRTNDPELLEQRFAANIGIFVPERSQWQSYWQIAPDSMRRSEALQLFAFRQGVSPPSPLGRNGQQVARELEAKAQEAGETVGSYLPYAVAMRHFDYIGATGGRDGEFLYFRLLAPSEEVARERSEAFVRMLHRTVRIPLQQHLRAELQAQEQAVKKLEQELEEAQRVATAIDEMYQEGRESGINSNELSSLKTERRLLDVDLAGIRARMDAAEEILAKLDRNAIGDRSRIEKVEDIKVTAEIDLAGLAARRNALDQFIRLGLLQKSLAAKNLESQHSVDEIRRALATDQPRLDALLELEESFAKLFAFEDDKIVIHPIKWTGTE